VSAAERFWGGEQTWLVEVASWPKAAELGGAFKSAAIWGTPAVMLT